MSSLKQSLHFGLEFVAFLGDRINGINEIELRRIYNNNFKQRKEMLADKGGVIITSDPMTSNGKVQVSVDLGKKHLVVRFHIDNRSPSCINFTYYTAISRIHHPSLQDERRVSRVNPVLLCSGNYDVMVHYKLDQYGYFPATVFFEFQPDVPKASPFYIVREIEVSVETPLDSKLGPVSPYKPFQKVTRRPVGWLVKERVPPVNLFLQKVPAKVKLGKYICPRYLKKLVKHKMEDSELFSSLDRQRKCLDSSLDMENYSRRFHLLLHLEEIRMEADIRKYDLHDQTMSLDQHNRNLFVLEVPGLAENRPSVLRGDCLRVTRSDDTAAEITVYEGRVHKIEQNKLLLDFPEMFVKNFISKMKFNVEFTFNRFTLRLQHQAVDLATKHQLGDVLFPSGAAKSSFSLPKLSMFNHHLDNNPEQLKAVQHIVAGSSQPAPYVVFGPPGTGKTVTLVEAINQILKLNSSAHILACAPTNSACDVLCELLLSSCSSDQVYRVYAQSRDPASVSTPLLVSICRKHCNIDEKQDCFSLPKTEDLMTFGVIVTTLYTAGRLVMVGVPVNHFSHVFVDEAGQGLESETVIAIAGLLSPQEGQLVLAGDPKQLGPIVHSPIASKHQFGLSLVERLMDFNDLYKTSNPRFVTTLQGNYRSHEAILKIPNEEFYEGKLQVFADKKEREAFCSWDGLNRKGFPVIFHGVMGKDEREQNSPSFFNVTEINILFKYLKELLDDQGKKGLPKISAEDIGIIAPYRKQVEKIRLGLKELIFWVSLLQVGSVEEFQGQEKKIIMISTVRSTSSYVKMDKDFNTGFLSNDKRFNVAITRAKSLLIVVGNPLILRSHPVWKKYPCLCLLLFSPAPARNGLEMIEMMKKCCLGDTNESCRSLQQLELHSKKSNLRLVQYF
uniref:RNA helicase n=1 Tax=Oryzias latipes TaxID=8090 RepID=A0A3P9J5U5_ORYLA